MPKRVKRLKKKSKFIAYKIRTFYTISLLALAILVISVFSVKNTAIEKSSEPFSSQNVLGEQAKKILSPCSSGGLTTSVHKRNQGSYVNEDFIRINDLDLLKDVNQLKDLTCLQYLDATNRTIKGDIANVKNLVNLEIFSLYSNPEVYGDICSLSKASNLRAMKFAFDPKITGDISCLKGLTNLENFAMTHTQIKGDLSALSNMTHLKAIYINGTNISGDICALKDLTNLQELGIANEYPGNRNIRGDLSCLDNLKKLTRAEIYSTSTTNCEQFTKSHPNIEQGGCSKESLKTLIDYGQKYEEKIGKVVQGGGPNNYKKDAFSGFFNGEPNNKRESAIPDNRNFLAKFFSFLIGIFNRNTSTNVGVEPLQNGPVLRQNWSVPQGGGPGGCKSFDECNTFCSKPENDAECSKFAPPGEEPQAGGQSKTSKLTCRISILPASKGTAPYETRICVDNPNEVIQQKYIDYVDYDGNGSWDYQGRWDQQGSVHGCHGYTFQSAGIFTPKAKIIDQLGNESDICQKTATVN